MDTQYLSTLHTMDHHHELSRVEEISSNLLPERALHIGKVDLRRSFLENLLEHRALLRAGAPVEGKD